MVEASDAVPAAFRSAAGSIGLPARQRTALELIEAVCPLATTSANISGLQAPGSFDALDPRLAARVGVVMADDRDGDKSGIAYGRRLPSTLRASCARAPSPSAYPGAG
ncbi:MAG: Sua5/YciO/YrdC/YwlC family protein [Eggerthella lenta]